MTRSLPSLLKVSKFADMTQNLESLLVWVHPHDELHVQLAKSEEISTSNVQTHKLGYTRANVTTRDARTTNVSKLRYSWQPHELRETQRSPKHSTPNANPHRMKPWTFHNERAITDQHRVKNQSEIPC